MGSLYDRQRILVSSAETANHEISTRISSLNSDILRLNRSTQFYRHTESQIRTHLDSLVQQHRPTTAASSSPSVTSPIFHPMTYAEIRHLDRPVSMRERVRRLVLPL